MWLFRKKKMYLLTWAYGANRAEWYSDYIIAYDIGDMWKKHKEDHPIPTFCVKVEEIE